MPVEGNTKINFGSRQSIEDVIGVKERITMESVRHGLPTRSIGRLGVRLGLIQVEVLRLLGLSKQSHARREESGLLTVDESDLVVRFARLLVLAILLFEDNLAAVRWLNTPASALGNETPLAHASTGFGSRNVERY